MKKPKKKFSGYKRPEDQEENLRKDFHPRKRSLSLEKKPKVHSSPLQGPGAKEKKPKVHSPPIQGSRAKEKKPKVQSSPLQGPGAKEKKPKVQSSPPQGSGARAKKPRTESSPLQGPGAKRLQSSSLQSPGAKAKKPERKSSPLPGPGGKPEEHGTRLNKYLAHAGIASRRAADILIMQGHVTVNGTVVQEMGYKVQEKDVVKFKGKPIKPVDKLVYYLLNKPRNVLSTSQDEKGRKTVIDIIAKKVPERVYPIGRLDRNTSGLILLTNDGELTKKLSHPSHKVPKVYHVTLDKNLSLKDLELIRSGITLEDGDIKADSLHYIENLSKREVQIELHSGKNHIVRRIFEHLGYEMVKLDRTYYAGLTKKNLPRGFFRPLTKEEVRMLKHFV